MCLAIPGKVCSIEGDDPLVRHGKVDFGGILRDVSFAGLPDVELGKYVIVHAGFALSMLDEEEAKKTIDLFREIEAAGVPGDPPA